MFVFEVVPAMCERGLPNYIKDVVDQAVETQIDCDVVFASNFKSCTNIAADVNKIRGIRTYDIDEFASNMTVEFKSIAKRMFSSDGGFELWITSALRFFYMADVMKHYSFSEMLHVESDNMLYGKVSSILPSLRENYVGLAATPANAQVTFITASVLWVHNASALSGFNEFMLALGANQSEWKKYVTYLRPHFCCKHGGVDPDADGQGILPFAVNEMSILAYYRYLFPDRFQLLPVVPLRDYKRYKYIVNLNLFTSAGAETGGTTGEGIWDPGSWGQFLGGIAKSPGNSKGFSDPTHIPGQAMRVRNCRPAMRCANASWFHSIVENRASDTAAIDVTGGSREGCKTAPFVRCLEGQPGDERWTPLWNLHIHSKRTKDFKSVSCPCSSVIDQG